MLDTLTCFENIALALTIQKVKPKEIQNRVKEVASKLDITEILKKYPYQISGGQKQRVASARAIITNPKLVLADEPTGALDTKTSVQIMDILKKISKDKLIIMVTHNPELAEKYSSRVVKILDGVITDDSNNELIKGNSNRKQFFEKIIEVQTLLGGDLNDVI